MPPTEKQLGIELKSRYNKAPENKKVVAIHLFGIEYADEINDNKYSIQEIIEVAGLPRSYATELRKGMTLAEYVEIKKHLTTTV